MYLAHVLKNDPQLLETALTLHQNEKIPPNTWVIDLDMIVENARALAAEAKKLGLTTYLMSKQHNRNPYITLLALSQGLNKLVAVDATCTLHAKRYNIPLGHAGHLNQIPRKFILPVLQQKPDVITIYNFEHAKWINDAAKSLGIVQNLLIRVSTKGDIFFDGQEGGFDESEIDALAILIRQLTNVKLIGVTSFPCIKYNETIDDKNEITHNMKTIIRVAEKLKKLGFDITQINAPANTSCVNMHILKEHGATHVEPGNGLLGTTPNHAFQPDLPEKTAFCYVTEVSHFFNKHAYAYGGAVFHTAYSNNINALIGSTWNEAKENRIEYFHEVVQNIDYHMQFKPKAGQKCEIGDTALLVYRTQMHMTRAYIAPVSGISGKRPLKLHYLFDNACTALDQDFMPVDPRIVRKDIDKLIETY